MVRRLKCSACGKTMVLYNVRAGSTLICIACGAKNIAPEVESSRENAQSDSPAHAHATAPGVIPHQTPDSLVAARTTVSRAPGDRMSGAAERSEKSRSFTAPVWTAIIAIAAAGVFLCIGWMIGRGIAGHASHESASNDVNNAIVVNPAIARVQGSANPPGTARPATRPAPLAVNTPATKPSASTTQRAGADALDIVATSALPSHSADVSDHAPATAPAPAETVAAQNSANSPSPRESVSSASPPATRPEARVAAPATRPVYTIEAPPPFPRDTQVSHAQIEQAMRRAVDFLLTQFEDGAITIRYAGSESRRAGLDALCVYSLLQAGQTIRDDRLDPRGRQMKRMLEKLKAYRIEPNPSGPFQPVTYGKSLRALALSVYDRPEDRKVFKDDVTWLMNEEEDGAYSYGGVWSVPKSDNVFGDPNNGYAYRGKINFVHICHPNRSIQEWWTRAMQDNNAQFGYLKPPLTTAPIGGYTPEWRGAPLGPAGAGAPVPAVSVPAANGRLLDVLFPWDNSNSQYGLLGVWCGAQAGFEIPERYWQDVEGHWLHCELRTGEWGYNRTRMAGSLAMTCAGVASLMMTQDQIASAGSRAGSVGRDTFGAPLEAGLTWLEQGDHAISAGGEASHYVGYDLFAIQRVGIASGFKYLGAHDWYRELAGKAVANQWPNGAWGRGAEGEDTVIDTAYVLSFLSQGRHPVFMNKLRFDGYWRNRPSDVASLTRFASRNTERPLNWQVVTFAHGWEDWLDCPVLYIASHKAPGMTEEDFGKLRSFVEAGGLIFTHADAGSEEFTQWVNDTLIPRIAPGRAIKPLSDGNPIFHVNYDISAGAVKLMGVDNGSRLLLVHSPRDLSKAWQGKFEKVKPEAFRIGLNIYLYAAGKVERSNPFATPVLPEPPVSQGPAMPVARVRYGGNWNPEPYAWARLTRACRWDTGLSIAPTPVDLSQLGACTAPLAELTGTASQTFDDADARAVHDYVRSGGVLLIDPCNGSGDFTQSVKDLLAKAFPNQPLADMPANAPIFKGLGATPNDFGAPRLTPYAREHLRLSPPHLMAIQSGKGAVIFCPLDLTVGLLGAHTWPIMGYDPASSLKMVENALVCAAMGKPIAAPKSAD